MKYLILKLHWIEVINTVNSMFFFDIVLSKYVEMWVINN